MNEDEQKRLEAEGAGGGGATMSQAPAPSVQPAPAPVGAGVAPVGAVGANDPATRAGAQMVGDAIQAAEVPPPTGVGSDPLERYGGTQNAKAEMGALAQNAWRRGSLSGALDDKANGYQSPSSWPELMNSMFIDKFGALTDRTAERLAQPQQETAAAQQQQAPMQPNNTPEDPFAISAPKQASAAQPVQKSGKMVFGAQQNFASAAQDRANEFVGGYFA